MLREGVSISGGKGSPVDLGSSPVWKDRLARACIEIITEPCQCMAMLEDEFSSSCHVLAEGAFIFSNGVRKSQPQRDDRLEKCLVMLR